ncbi:MAG TPA: hypothetical protein VKB02_16665 [Pyrinomonadaceae bacterium]|nr:hypothetical protein [Pyrinomonadaceae bacterium]
MKFVQLLVVACLTCTVMVNAQTPSDRSGVEMTSGQDAYLANLQLNTDLIKLEACSREILRFTLRLNFTNKGKNVVILDKKSSEIPRYMISRSLKDAIKKKYEIEGHVLIGLDPARLTDDSVPEESAFVVLKPGEVYSFVEVFDFDGRVDEGSHDRPLRGLNFLQFVVLTWYYPRASNTKWRDQWQPKGYLWSDPITSNPMPFVVEKNTPVIDCR